MEDRLAAMGLLPSAFVAFPPQLPTKAFIPALFPYTFIAHFILLEKRGGGRHGGRVFLFGGHRPSLSGYPSPPTCHRKRKV